MGVIFDRFGQVETSLHRNHEGSGIGLSLAKAMVEAHRGTITVKSEYGKGSEFLINIPVNVLPESKVVHVTKSDRGYNGQETVEKVQIEFSDIYAVHDME